MSQDGEVHKVHSALNSAATAEPDALAARVRRLEDIEAIKELKHRYVVLLDRFIADPDAVDDFIDLFVADLEVEYDAYGAFSSRETLRAFLCGVISPAFSWGFHAVHNPRIEVDGGLASAEWCLSAQALHRGATAVVAFYGHYVDHYVRTGDGWRIKKSALRFTPPPVP